MHFEVTDPESSLMVTEEQLGECGTHLDATGEISQKHTYVSDFIG